MVETGIQEPELHEYIDFTDWFIFEWENEEGGCVLDEFLASEPNLSEPDRQILLGWYEAVDDVFQVLELESDGVTLRDAEGTIYFALPTNMPVADLGWNVKSLVHTRLVPVGSVYLLSGIQSCYEGPDIQSLPDGVDYLTLAQEIIAADTDQGEDGFFVADVRHLSSTERPPGSVAQAAFAFLDSTTSRLKPETAELYAVAVSLLVHFCREREIDTDTAVTADALLDFLAVWYPRVTQDRTVGATRSLLTTIGRFATWLDRNHADGGRRGLPRASPSQAARRPAQNDPSDARGRQMRRLRGRRCLPGGSFRRRHEPIAQRGISVPLCGRNDRRLLGDTPGAHRRQGSHRSLAHGGGLALRRRVPPRRRRA